MEKIGHGAIVGWSSVQEKVFGLRYACVTCRSCWFPGLVALSRCIGPEGWLHRFEMVTKHFANPNLSVVDAKCMQVFGVCGLRQNLYVFSLYCNPDLYDWIVYCLLTSLAAV